MTTTELEKSNKFYFYFLLCIMCLFLCLSINQHIIVLGKAHRVYKIGYQ